MCCRAACVGCRCNACVENVRRMMSLDQTVVGRCVVVVDTLHATLRFTIAASASITGAAMSSVRAAPSSCRSTDAAERRYIHQQLEQNWLIV